MPTHFRDPALTCDNCSATAPRAPRGEGLERYREAQRKFYESGWRVRSNPEERPLRLAPHTVIVSCPNCPPVVVY